MVKIGCVGYGGRHGEFFSRVFNQQNAFPGYHMSYVFGEDEVLTPEERQRRFFQVEHDCSSLDELIRCSDAVMILTVRGEDHARYALKVIEAGKPLFVDKPFTASLDEAREITRAAEARGVPLFGGSTLRHLQKVEEIQALMQQEDFPAVGTPIVPIRKVPLAPIPFMPATPLKCALRSVGRITGKWRLYASERISAPWYAMTIAVPYSPLLWIPSL